MELPWTTQDFVLELFSHDLPEVSGQDAPQNFVVCV
jgi:hypothetical protein